MDSEGNIYKNLSKENWDEIEEERGKLVGLTEEETEYLEKFPKEERHSRLEIFRKKLNQKNHRKEMELRRRTAVRKRKKKEQSKARKKNRKK